MKISRESMAFCIEVLARGNEGMSLRDLEEVFEIIGVEVDEPPDVAKERWEIMKEEGGQLLKIITPIPFFNEPITVVAWHIPLGDIVRARVMASAPEMLGALEALEKLGYGGRGVKEKVRSSIKKARGE